jgi:two-component system, chemotaxis family, sensor kinase CheA
MADNNRLIKLVDDAVDVFAADPPDREKLQEILLQLNAFLMDCEGFPYEVVDRIWQAAKKLQGCLNDDKGLQPDQLSAIFEQVAAAADSLREDDPDEAPASTANDVSHYTIPEDDVPLIEDFITESTEHLEAAEAAMLELENNLKDSDTLNLIFRSFHTIKGMAGFMNLEQVGALAHDAENLLDLARKDELLLSGSNADAIFKAIDMLKTMVASIRNAIESDCVINPLSGVDELIQFIRTCAKEKSGTPSTPKKAPAAKKAKATTEPPPVSKPDPQPSIETAPEPPSEKSDLEPSEQEASVTQESLDLDDDEPKEQTPATGSQQKKVSAHIDEKIKVSTSRLDSLVNMVGELVIAQLMVTESLKSTMAADHNLLRNTTHQSKIIRELQELSMSMRMVPIGGIFQKMARMTRDLSRRAGKQIDFVMKGEQTELDRTIVDKLADPLIHMIRNSVDHGVESPEERLKAGKGSTGRVELRAFHMAGNIVIEIEDDGRGLNKQKLQEKAVNRGVVSADKSMTDQEIFSLIFHPGLSTAEKVTSVSGRGVGMDVVKRNIEELRGRIDIASELNKGTTFTITLPLTLAIIDGQIVRIGKEKYIIPINAISKSFRPTPQQISTVQGAREMVMERGELLPLVRLHELFNIEPDATEATDGLVVIVEEDNQACCLLVDDLLDQQQVVIKNLGEILKHTDGISGGAIMGDGLVSLILDIPGIIKLYRG